MKPIRTCMWFDGRAEEAARFYTTLFPSSRLGTKMRYDETTAQASGQPVGSVLTVEFEINGQPFLALNGGPQFKFSEAVSFIVGCATQAEIDRYWDALTADGGEPGQCGWLKDRFGVSWQIVPEAMSDWLADPGRAARVMPVLLQMRKLDLEALRAAATSN